MNVLVVNAGSSSLKYQLFDTTTNDVLAKGICERIGIGGKIEHKIGDKKYTEETEIPNHTVATRLVVKYLTDEKMGCVKSMDEIEAVGHRIVHGGEYFNQSVLINDEVIARIEELCSLAPLHNPASLLGIRAIQALLPDVPQVAVFDTAFHQTMKPEAYMYALPLEQYKKYKIRRYGMHGTSHLFVSREAAKLIGKEGNIITCHIGNGASISAVKNGECQDTSMGFTPLAGVVMGTRSGDLDPIIPLYIMKSQNKTVDEVDNLLNKQSGMFGLCGYSDNRDVEAKYLAGDPDAITAMQVYTYAIVKYIGAYTAALGGADAIVFTGGVGENGSMVRKMICDRLAFMGIELDEEANNTRGKTIEISKPGSKVRVFVIPTNEELVIAQDTVRLI